MGTALYSWIELLAVAVFALTGSIVAARNRMDPVGFILLAAATGVGGGTVRDALLAQPAFWLARNADLLCCAGVALAAFWWRGTLRMSEMDARRFRILPWADAFGLALFAVAGGERALAAGCVPFAAIVLGTITATFGGIIRDVLVGGSTLVASREIYVTAAFLAAAVDVGLGAAIGRGALPALCGFAAGFGLRAAALVFRWQLPPYRSDNE